MDDDDGAGVVRRFVAGEQDGLAGVYTRWSPLVYSIALRTLGEADQAERVTERVFTTAWADRGSLPADHTAVASWLIEITRQAIVSTMTQGGDTIDFADLTDRLLVADELSRLDAEPQQVLRLALFEGLGVQQIADRTHLPPDTVGKHLRRGLLELRNRLEVTTDAR